MAFRNLADQLGVKDPEGPPGPDPVDLPDLTGAQFCKAVVDSRQYRESIVRRILFGDLPPAVECRILDQAWGAPPKRVELTGKDGGAIEVTRVERVIVDPALDSEDSVTVN